MKYVCMLVVLAGCVGDVSDARTFDDPHPNSLALEGDGGTCDTRADARAEVLARLGIDESECEARPNGTDACADDVPAGSPGTIVLAYAPYMTGTAVRVSREPGGNWWSIVCSCAGCSNELGFDSGTWPARIHANGRGQTWLF